MKKSFLRRMACLMMAVMIGTCMGNATGVFAEDAAVTENAAEVIDVETKVNESWGVYTDTISVGTLQKYADGVTMTLDFTVDEGCNYAMVTAVDAGNSWSKMVDYITGAEFNSDDGGFIVFGATEKTVTMTLNAEGVKQIIDHGQGLLFQGFQIDVTKVTLMPVAAEPAAVPEPTATPAPTELPKEEPTASETPAEEPKEEPAASETPAEEPKEEPKEEPAASETPAEEPKKEAIEVVGTEYVVKAGDTLGEIAAAAGISVQELAQANQITNVDLIRKGAVLVIPTVDKTARHLVVKGDTLSEIAKTYGYKLADLVSANNIANPDLIVIGQVIVLP